MADDMIRVKTGVEVTGRTDMDDIVEIPRAEWNAMTPAQREERLEQIAQESLENAVNAYAYVDET